MSKNEVTLKFFPTSLGFRMKSSSIFDVEIMEKYFSLLAVLTAGYFEEKEEAGFGWCAVGEKSL